MSTLTEAAAACTSLGEVPREYLEAQYQASLRHIATLERQLADMSDMQRRTQALWEGQRADLATAANVAANQAERIAEYAREVERRDEYLATADARPGAGRPRGRAETKPVLLPLSPSLAVEVTAAAEAAGLTRVEWLRRAAAYCLATKVPLTHLSVG